MSNKEKREVGDEAVWSLSTAKPGNGVDQLRDGNLDSYWQSDGAQPHLINIQFHKKMTLSEVELYLDYKSDESYTPKKISIRAGTTFHDLGEVECIELKEPNGWTAFSLSQLTTTGRKIPLRANFLQLAVLTMHQNGRDTHIRQVKIYTPRKSQDYMFSLLPPSSVEFSMTSCIR